METFLFRKMKQERKRNWNKNYLAKIASGGGLGEVANNLLNNKICGSGL